MERSARWTVGVQALLLWLTFVSECQAQIRVTAPETLVNRFKETQGRIDGVTSTFGAPFVDDRILGRLVWSESKQGNSHCQEDDYDIPSPGFLEDKPHLQVPQTRIVLVRRGHCSLFTKVEVAQRKGAHAVIAVDQEDSGLTTEDLSSGSDGKNVTIPSMLISKKDGDALLEAVSADKASQVIVELAWGIPTNHPATVDLWMSSASGDAVRFLQEFAAKRKALAENVKFLPHYHVVSKEGKNAADCIEDADFCTEDPDGSGHITGRMVLEEDLRQLCIHEVKSTGSTTTYAEKFWDYVEALSRKCPLAPSSPDASSPKFGSECSKSLMVEVGIDVPAVLACTTSRRDELLKLQRDHAAWSPQALRINGWRFTGQLDADLVARAICTGFETQPKACENLVEPTNPFEDRSSGVGFGLTSFVIGLAVTVLVVLGALALYKQSLTRHIHSALREEVMLEVQAQLDSYKQMS